MLYRSGIGSPSGKAMLFRQMILMILAAPPERRTVRVQPAAYNQRAGLSRTRNSCDLVVEENELATKQHDNPRSLVYINRTQYFEGVPKVAWNFYIRGYQPAQNMAQGPQRPRIS